MTARSDELDGLLLQVRMILSAFPQAREWDWFTSITRWRREPALKTEMITIIKARLERAKELL